MIFLFKKYVRYFALVALMGGAACSGGLVREADYAPTPDIPEDARPAPVIFSGIELLLPPGMNIGQSRNGVFCNSPAYPISRNILSKKIDRKFLRQDFHDALEANGYDVVGSLDVAFEPDDEMQRAEYSIKGKVKDVQLDTCSSEGELLGLMKPTAQGDYGRMYVAIDWSVYDYLKRTVVYKVRTEGYTERNVPNIEGLSLLFHDAFEMAAHNLAADESFRALLVDGVKPARDLDGRDWRGEKLDQRPRIYDPDEEVAILGQPLSRQPFAKEAQEKRKVAVMVQKRGHGSGFFITKQGHILTNAHVVGEARRMRIVTGFRKTGIVAEVLRVDRARDVALLRLEEIPEWLDMEKVPLLPIRLDWPKVGEDIYALGTPMDWKSYRHSVTKGIVSAHRKYMKVKGVRENYIQGDVAIHGGSSGGPLLDENGNIVGLSVMGEGRSDDNFGHGLNLFIPIGEALDRLGVSY